MTRPTLPPLVPALLLGALLVVGLVGRPAAGTTYAMVSDAELVTQAAVIAEVEVLGSAAAADAAIPSTDYQVAVLRVLKGATAGPNATVRVPGGVSAEGVGYRVWGAPAFAPGERALLFLLPAADGAYRILHLLLGAFHEVELGGRKLALRDLSGATEASFDREGRLLLEERPTDLPRDFEAFSRWISTGAGDRVGYFVHDKSGALDDAIASYTFLTDPNDGGRIRWFGFEQGDTIGWQADSRGQPGLAGGGFSELQRAIAAWNNDPSSIVRYGWSGTTSSLATRCAPPFGLGKLVFEDPVNEIGGAYGCSGGILAQGGPCYQLSFASYRGTNYHPAVDAHIVTNDGLTCFFDQSASPGKAAEELFAHELGHTLGFGHSATRQALMHAFIHDDGRGAQLHADDRAGLAEVYGNGTTPPPPPPPTPAAPSQLVAAALSTTQIRLTWRDNAGNESGYRVERRGYAGFSEIASLPAGATSFTVSGLSPATPYEFRVRAVNAQGFSAFSNVGAAVTRGVLGPCVANATTLCLLSGAVRVEVDWKNQHGGGALGTGRAVPMGNKSGSFWFFSPDNIELLVKGLDGGPLNGYYWFFYGALSDVEYWVRVTQTATGEVAVYHNPPGQICGEGDVGALAKADDGAVFALPDEASAAFADLPAGAPGPCAAGPEALCLLGGRFEVRVNWRDHRNGGAGTGKRVTVSDRSGYFWFFNADNLELVVKALDGRGQNGHFWFFYGALSDVEYTLRVRDTVTGATRLYNNQAGEICGEGDVEAF